MTSLKAFEAAARHMSFTRAALELKLTPTDVGHQIEHLESVLGTSLFARNSDTLVLTDTAETYLRVVRSAIIELTAASDRVARENDDRLLTIECLEAFAIKSLLPDLRLFRKQYPHLSLRLRSVQSVDASIDHHTFDVAIWHGTGDWPGVVAHKLGTEAVFPVCSPGWLAGSSSLQRPADLMAHTVIRTSSLILRDEWPLWLEAAGASGLEFGPQLCCNYLLGSIEAALNNLGIVLGRASIVGNDLANGRLVEPFNLRAATPFAYYLVVPQRCEGMSKVRVFREWLLAHFVRRPIQSRAS